jgi:hypothetical protein
MMQQQPEFSAQTTQSDAVLYFIRKLDVGMVSDFLDDKRSYQDMPKFRFINKLEIALDKFIDAGDTWLEHYEGCCVSTDCNFKFSGYRFVGNNSTMYMDLIVEVKDGIVLDIYECTQFLCSAPFENISTRVRIDRYIFPFDKSIED